MKKYNIALISLTIGYGSIAQPLQYDNSNVDTIIIESIAYVAHDVKRNFHQKTNIYTLYYDSNVDDFVIKSYIKTEQLNSKIKQKTVEKYDSLYNAKEKIQNLLFSVEQTYKSVNLSDFDIDENNIGSLIDSAFLLWTENTRSQERYKDIQKCKNIDDFRAFLTEQYSEDKLKEHKVSSNAGQRFSIYIKTSLNTYWVTGSTYYRSNQPWNRSLLDVFSSPKYSIINFDINNSLLEILPKDFLNIVKLTVLGVMQDYIDEWCCKYK